MTLRKLVERARATGSGEEQRRVARESTFRFVSAIAGNLPGYEEAIRALFAGDQQKYLQETSNWPEGVKEHATILASPSFAAN